MADLNPLLFGGSEERGCLVRAAGGDFNVGLIRVGSLAQLVHMCSPLSLSAFSARWLITPPQGYDAN